MSVRRCLCCGKGGRGLIESMPNMWWGCNCIHLPLCKTCVKCHEHCQCVPLEQRIDLLTEEAKKREALLEQARALAVALDIEELNESFKVDDVRELMVTMRRQYMAI